MMIAERAAPPTTTVNGGSPACVQQTAQLAGPAARFASRDGSVYLLSEERVPDAVVDKSSMLSTLRLTSGRRDELPFSRDGIVAWKHRAFLSEAARAQLPARAWDATLTNLEVRISLA
jgi:hypothetical protein